jgi:hypothetical protein
VFDHFRGNLTAADLFSDGFAAVALSLAERSFPVLQPVSVADHAPLVRPPSLPDVPRPRPAESGPDPAGLLASLAGLAAGVGTLARGRGVRWP